MTDNDVNLSDEQRIYVEDYVQKELQKEKGTTVVEVGESVDISSELLENAISNANDLTAEQLSNLSQYTAFVSF
jgi:plasmid maintenance system antidote protein VapI